jgi:hypothetical protein
MGINSGYRQEMISMLLWQIYLVGALVAATGASVAADLFSDPDVPTTSCTTVIVLAGVVWPVLLIGLLQMMCIGGLAKAMSTALALRHVSRRPAARSQRLDQLQQPLQT